MDVTVDSPALRIGDQLTFVPWVQPQLAAAAVLGGLRPTLRLGAKLMTDQNTSTIETLPDVTAEIYGAGDVLGINQRAILGTSPNPNATGFSPLQLASIEFKEEDLPWRYSARYTSGAAPAPLPWCFLMVMTSTEYDLLPLAGQPLPSVRIHANGPYPSTASEQAQLWAHMQVNARLGSGSADNPATSAEIATFLRDVLPSNPNLAYSRVFCPRRLAPDTAYYAFLLPAIEAGRLAGLGQEYTQADTTASAITATSNARDFPVYFQWQFTTGQEDDFEALAGQLHQANATTAAASLPRVTVKTADHTYQLAMPSLLVDADAPASEEPPLAVAQYLYGKLAPGFTLTRPATGRPVVTPPLYGRAYMGVASLVAPTTGVVDSWKNTVNLDPRYRAVAALGVEVVQENQEEFVRRAWEQAQDILLANEKLRGAQYGLRTTAGMRDKHLPLEVLDDATGPGSLSGKQVSAQSAAKAFRTAAASSTATTTTLADYGLHLTGLALSRIRVSAATVAASTDATGFSPFTNLTVREAIRRSSTPLAAFSPAFRRVVKPFGNYVVGAAGRPLRPTQTEPDAAEAPANLQQAGTSLRQRDTLLSSLAAGLLTAAAARPEQVRAYQFDDATVDQLLLRNNVQLTLRENGVAITNPTILGRFNAAYAAFKDLGENTTLGFLRPQRVRPALPLAGIKQDVIFGTQPGPIFVVRVQQAAPTITLPATTPQGDFEANDFNATDFYVGDFDEENLPAPGSLRSTAGRNAVGGNLGSTNSLDAALPVLKQAKVSPVFKDAMGEHLRQRHPDLFVPALGDFPAGGIAVLGVNHAFIEAYMLGLNHALGSELLWRGFPVDLRGTFFQQFWDVSEHLNAQLDPTEQPTAAQEQALLDVRPVDQWTGTALGANEPAPATVANEPLRLALRSELFRRYPTLVLGLQPGTADGPDPDPNHLVYPRQRLPVGQDLVAVTFDITLAVASAPPAQGGYYLVLMERPGQPQFGLDELVPANTAVTADPVDWNSLSWEYLGTSIGANLLIDPQGKPRASTEPASLEHLTDSAEVAYALFQEPVLAAIPVHGLLA